MAFLIFLPFFIQMVVITFDEFYFHVRRGLPKWERVGHPLDTLTVLLCFLFALYIPYSPLALKIYIGLAIFSCVFVTKDEFVHKECCPASEQWLHALLFINHPIVLTATGLLWAVIQGVAPEILRDLFVYKEHLHTFLCIQTGSAALFLSFQSIYWNVICKE